MLMCWVDNIHTSAFDCHRKYSTKLHTCGSLRLQVPRGTHLTVPKVAEQRTILLCFVGENVAFHHDFCSIH